MYEITLDPFVSDYQEMCDMLDVFSKKLFISPPLFDLLNRYFWEHWPEDSIKVNRIVCNSVGKT